jgi:transposase
MRHHPNRALSQERMEARRLRSVPYFKKQWSERRIAEKLGVSGPTVHEWKERWEKNGRAGLRAGHYGRASRLSPKQERQVQRNILNGAAAHGFQGDFWTLKRLTIAVQRWTGTTYEDRSIWHAMHRLGFSCQRPVRKAVERDEGAIRTWMLETWPKVKKGASKQGQYSAFSTSQGSPTAHTS